MHLVVLPDPETGGERLALTAPLFREAWQNDITTAAANTAHGILAGEPSVAGVVALARHAMDATSKLVDGLFARARNAGVACRAGCDHCCYQVVGVTPPEAIAIAIYLQEMLDEAAFARVVQRVTELHERARELSSAERFSPDHPCVFLDVEAGRCTIYAVRPLACRGMNSLDATECATRLRDPRARADFLARGTGGRSYLEPIRAFHAISAGLQLALFELYRLDMRPLELAHAMFLLLAGPESLASAWIEGRNPFEAALASDKSEDANLHALSGVLPER